MQFRWYSTYSSLRVAYLFCFYAINLKLKLGNELP
jgi:hypothetical protein